MALFIRQNEDRSKLQERLAAELREKAKQKAQIETTYPDGVTDSAYLKDTESTSSLTWLWILIILLVIVGIIIFIIFSK